MTLRTKSAAQTKYPRHDFAGTHLDKAHMLGFRYGDLNVYMPKGKSETLVVRSHTTLLPQAHLFNSLFKRYGMVITSRNARSLQQTCYLNESFKFLLGKYPDEIRKWLLKNDERFWAFAAGYIDAEGTFGLNQGKGRFKIDAYDLPILQDMNTFLMRKGIHTRFLPIARKGENDYGWVWREDVWRLSVNQASSIELLIKRLYPLLRHGKRRADARKVLRNIVQRRRNGTIR
ncbi:hypothetical protein KGO04_01600 [Patescibacteria group bacterium]|nr:hypothetical protein [Patescibacteria group bacterium]MDE1944509.1 LAGLIDADG family homing endonuclease [Patescibacteria group bacterium]MDE1945278.1 LAGLIDADG family homing endonuclease [Patescibacteria group bacterium]